VEATTEIHQKLTFLHFIHLASIQFSYITFKKRAYWYP